jgi:glycosyltransferase involved in cell wall biosynthesis
MPETPRIRILFVIGTLDVGGAERQLVEMTTNLDSAFEPAVCCLTRGGPLVSELEQAGVPVFVIGLRGVRNQRGLRQLGALFSVPGALMAFFRHLRQFRPHVVHGVLFHAYVLAAAAASLARVPVVITSRRSLSHFKRSRPLYRLVEGFANRRTDRIIANSEAVRLDTVSSEGLPQERVDVIYNGLDLRLYERPVCQTLRDALQLGEGPVALTLANLIPYKGHADLLEAWASVCAFEPSATLLLAGDGPARPALEAQARQLRLDNRVRFLGLRRDVPELLTVADLLVHPSHQEGFCNALLEAMAAGKPVVATAVGGNAEAVSDGATGYIVPARDAPELASAVLRVLGSTDRGRAMGARGKLRVGELFGREVMVRRYEATYRAALAAKGVDVSDVRNHRPL